MTGNSRPFPDMLRFRASPPETLVTSVERGAVGLHHWVDGTMGFLRDQGRTTVVAPNGPRLARHDLTTGTFVTGLLAADDTIEGLGPDVDHASGGPLHRDPDTGTVVLVYHGETFVGGAPELFRSFLGMAVSHDDARTFTDLGPIVTTPVPAPDDHEAHRRPVDVGPGGFVVRDGWFQLYFQDRGILETRLNLGTARARLDDIVHAAGHGRPPTFQKYFEGTWTEPGLGGRATDLLPDHRCRVVWFDVAHLVALDATLCVFSTVRRAAGGVGHEWVHLGAVATDGLDFSTPVPIEDAGDPAELIYLTLDSGGPDQRRIEGNRFDIYRVRSTRPYRWDDARLERVRVTWDRAAR